MSRWAAHVAAHSSPPPLPKLQAGHYLLDAMHNAGAFTQGDMGGTSPLTWQELLAFRELTGDISESWEARLVIELSREYVTGHNIGLNPLGIPPYGEASGPLVSTGFFAKLEALRKK